MTMGDFGYSLQIDDIRIRIPRDSRYTAFVLS